ncbi:lytic transglycosylase domain-containing protein [Streptomyces sp. IBSBF 2953]|uniref:aggregation-promoting factor C-terminal-like domain-containing protein n=1 Tax=Streptomyces TaxID=1883 RepID=UPI002119C37D|nr:transglycosylase SLT domain-containing protein [Streptomyces scabiei]MCQ9183620.1 lytic transglycosylase domain-containing protein [Streptomyces hayashii]MDX3116184.1 transglycosylase SLT domain-containing protein [Streptomyces scabiei]
MSPISARGFAVASATAVTTVGAVVGVAQGNALHPADDAQATGGSTLLADLPVGEQVEVQTASLTQQADAQAIAADVTAKKTAEETARKQAAKDAVAKQQAAVDKAKAEKEAKEAKERAETKADTETQSASGDATFVQQGSYSASEVQAIARQIVPGGQFQCFSNIVEHESGWNYKAVNPSSGAYGLVQAYPGSKMSSAGADWRTNPATQIKWGLNYMNVRYGSPCDAWDYWQANSSY